MHGTHPSPRRESIYKFPQIFAKNVFGEVSNALVFIFNALNRFGVGVFGCDHMCLVGYKIILFVFFPRFDATPFQYRKKSGGVIKIELSLDVNGDVTTIYDKMLRPGKLCTIK